MKYLIDYKNKRDFQKGITLIALVITIIILLILAIVSIKLLIDQGIIGNADKAAKKYTVEQEKELITVGYSNYQMAKYAATDKTAVEKLQKYFDLGIDNIAEETEENEFGIKFINNDVIEDAETSLKIIGYGEIEGQYFNRLSYKNNTYRMIIEDEEAMKFKIEFESMTIDSNDETEDLETLKYYFKAGGIAERKNNAWSNLEFIDNDIIKGSSEIKLLGQGYYTGEYSIQYKDYIYKLIVEGGQSCNDNFEFKDIKVEAVTFVQDILDVQGAKTKGNETNGWIITFDNSGNVYTLLSNGKITSGETENPSTKVNLKELIATEYAENSDTVIEVAHMEDGNEANQKNAYIYIVNKKFIMYQSSGENLYIMPIENITMQEFVEWFGSSSINTNITKLDANMWYKFIGNTNYNGASIVVKITMPNSIVSDFADEDINNQEVYNAIITNNTETPTRINLKELANSKFSENGSEEIKVAYIEDGTLMHKEVASIAISKINTNIIVIFNSNDKEKYFMSIEDTNTKDIATLLDNELQEKNIKSDMWYQIKKDWKGTRAEQVKIPTAITGDFEMKDILDLDLYAAIIGNSEF